MGNVKKGTTSAIIDPLLLEGGRTVAEIAAIAAPQVGMDVKKMANDIRVRMFVLRKRGYTAERDVEGKVKLTKPVTEAA